MMIKEKKGVETSFVSIVDSSELTSNSSFECNWVMSW